MFCLERKDSAGWGVNMHLLPLENGELLVYSPVWLGPSTFEQVEALGKPRILVCPNHFHHLSLQRFRDRYPDAVAVASAQAAPRLQRKGHVGLVTPDKVDLPEGMSLWEPAGTKNGEIWVSIKDAGAHTVIVGDAFFNVHRPLTGAVGAVLRLTKSGPGLSLGATWRLLHLADRQVYVRWVQDRFTTSPPDQLAFCHGTAFSDADVTGTLRTLMERRLPTAS